MTTKASSTPRLIRPTKDGQEGEWSYLYTVDGQDYIFPAQVNELGNLQPLLHKDEQEAFDSQHDNRQEPGDPRYVKKVVYWRASEWETKLLPLAVEWMN